MPAAGGFVLVAMGLALEALAEVLKKISPARLGAMIAVTLALVGFFGFVILRVSQPTMGVLYSELPFNDSSAVIKELEARAVRYETRQDGQTILVPRADIPKIRMEMAGKGLPTGGSVGYEIFDKGDAFSATSFVQNINHLRALEGELARTIKTIGRVGAARVHLVMPEKKLFERDREPPRASIVLKLRGELDMGQVRAIRHLVASAVEGLKPDRVSIVDESGRLLADGASGDGTAAAAEERQTGLERRLKRDIEEVIASVVGQGRTRVQVSAELDFNRMQETTENFDPESRVVRSTQTRNEQSASAEARDGQVSVNNELPGNQRGTNAGNGTRDSSQKNEEIVNYEISKTVRTNVQEAGRVKRISVAVLVDGLYSRNQAGELSYQPRPQEDLERIGALVRTAIGFDRNRGDQVEIVNLRFAEAPKPLEINEPTGIWAFLQPTKEDIHRAIELGVLAILSLIVMLAVVRPLVHRIVGPDIIKKTMAKVSGSDETPALAGATAGGAGGMLALPESRAGSAAAKFIELAQVNGQVQAQSLEKIGEVVKSNPQEAVAILRQMINQGA